MSVNEGPKDAGNKTIGILRSGGRVIWKTIVSKKGMEDGTDGGRTEELVILRADFKILEFQCASCPSMLGVIHYASGLQPLRWSNWRYEQSAVSRTVNSVTHRKQHQ